MSTLFTADLHMNDNPRDEDRWGLFDWILSVQQQHNIKKLVIMGDLTDAKDKHSSVLANRFATVIRKLSKTMRVYILKGNHDFIDPDWPYFEWLDYIENVDFFRKPEEVEMCLFDDNPKTCLFLPSTKDLVDWEGLDFEGADYIFTHHTFDGCLVENGTSLTGLSPRIFKDRGFTGKALSGDIHVPQIVGRLVEYVGAPYRCHFGDNYDARLMLLSSKGFSNLHYPARQRELKLINSVDDLRKARLTKGAQVKIRINVNRSDFDRWPALRKELLAEAKVLDLEVCGLEPIVPRATTAKSASQLAAPEDFTNAEDLIKARGERDRMTRGQVQTGLSIFKEVQGG